MDEKEMKILIFLVAGEYYAADIRDVERILGIGKTTPMPDAPRFIEGVINYEDEILPIVNLEKKFNLIKNNEAESKKVISIKRKEKKFGIIVDDVSEVTDISIDQFEEPPVIATKPAQKYIKGLIKLDVKIIILLSLTNLLTEEEEEVIFSEK